MPRWKVRVSGNARAAERARRFLPEDYEIELDDGRYFLIGSPFEHLENSRGVNESAESLVAALNNALTVLTDEDELSVNAVQEFDKAGNRVNSKVYGNLFIGVRTAVLVLASDPSSEDGKRLVRQHLLNSDVREAYGYLSEDAFSLWKAYEVIKRDMRNSGYEDFVEAATSMGWATEAELDNFEGSINSPEVLGDKARHARTKLPPPADPMTLRQAKLFVKRLLNHWTEYRDSTNQ